MGDLPQAGSVGESLTDFLPDLPAPPWIYTDNPVYRLLKDGRLDESSFDLKNSPLAIFLYHRLSPNVWGERARSSEEFFAGKLTAEAFLMGFDPKFRAEFGGACMRMVPTRREALESWLAARP
jgi:hypothetical protein